MREILGGDGETYAENVWIDRGKVSKKTLFSKREVNIWEIRLDTV